MQLWQRGQPKRDMAKNSQQRHGGRERWQQNTKFLEGDRLLAPFSTRRKGKDHDNFFLLIIIGFQATLPIKAQSPAYTFSIYVHM